MYIHYTFIMNIKTKLIKYIMGRECYLHLEESNDVIPEHRRSYIIFFLKKYSVTVRW